MPLGHTTDGLPGNLRFRSKKKETACPAVRSSPPPSAKPVGVAGHPRRTHPSLHVQRIRPVADPPAARRRQPPGLRGADVPAALPRSWPSARRRRADAPAAMDRANRLDPACWAVCRAGGNQARTSARTANGLPGHGAVHLTYRQAVHTTTELAMQTDKGIVLASSVLEHLRRQSHHLADLNAVERASAEAITAPTGASTTPWPNR